MKILCVTRPLDAFGNPTNGVRAARAAKDLGHEVSVVDHSQIGKHRPGWADFVLMFGTVVGEDVKRGGSLVRRIKSLVGDHAKLGLWYFDLCHPAARNAPWKFKAIERIARSLDVLATTDHSWPWEDLVTKYVHLPQGVDESEFSRQPAQPEPRDYDFLFTGGFGVGFEYREKDLEALMRIGTLQSFGRGFRKRVLGRAFWGEYQRARVAYVPGPPPEIPGRYWSNRVFLATATGTACLAGWTFGLDDYFKGDEEIVFFRDRAELAEQAERLLDDPLFRARVGRAGRARTLRDHTYRARMEKLIAEVGR